MKTEKPPEYTKITMTRNTMLQGCKITGGALNVFESFKEGSVFIEHSAYLAEKQRAETAIATLIEVSNGESSCNTLDVWCECPAVADKALKELGELPVETQPQESKTNQETE